MLKALLLNAALLFGASYASCTASVSLASLGKSLGNPLLGLTVKNTGSCPIIKVSLNINLAEGCLAVSPINLNLVTETTAVVTGFKQLKVGESISSSTFVVVCLNKNNVLQPQVSIKEVLCDSSCTAPTTAPNTKAPTTAAPTTTTAAPTTKAPTTKAPTTKAPTTKAPTTKAPTTKAPTTKAPTTKAPTTVAPTTQAPTSPSCQPCSATSQQWLAISYSSYNGTYGITVDSGGAAEAIAFANQDCTGFKNSKYGCAPVLVAENECGAIAISSKTSTPYPVNNYIAGVSTGNTATDAEAKALANCKCRISGLSGVKCTVKASACPTPTCPASIPKTTTVDVDFEDIAALPTVPGTAIPVPYKLLKYQGLRVIDVIATNTAPGVVPSSGSVYAFSSLISTTTAGTPTITSVFPGSTVTSFDLKQFYFGCVVNLEQGATALPSSCDLYINGFPKNSQTPITIRQTFIPPSPLAVAQMQKVTLPASFVNLDTVTFVYTVSSGSTALQATLSLVVDDLEYVANM